MKKIILLFTILWLSIFTNAQDATKGKVFYEGLCKACHSMDKKIIGPALANIHKKRSDVWLIAFIKDAPGFAKKDKDAEALIKEYNGVLMPAQPQLSDDDIKNIIAYISQQSETIVATTPAQPVQPSSNMSAINTEQIQAQNQNGLIWSIIFGIIAFVLIAWVLTERIKLANYTKK